MTKQKLWELIEAYRMSGGSEEHHARKERLDAVLDELLAQPEQEPVACTSLCVECTKRGDWVCAKAIPPQRTWIGLTDDEMWNVCAGGSDIINLDYAKAIEAKLKEKNT